MPSSPRRSATCRCGEQGGSLLPVAAPGEQLRVRDPRRPVQADLWRRGGSLEGPAEVVPPRPGRPRSRRSGRRWSSPRPGFGRCSVGSASATAATASTNAVRASPQPGAPLPGEQGQGLCREQPVTPGSATASSSRDTAVAASAASWALCTCARARTARSRHPPAPARRGPRRPARRRPAPGSRPIGHPAQPGRTSSSGVAARRDRPARRLPGVHRGHRPAGPPPPAGQRLLGWGSSGGERQVAGAVLGAMARRGRLPVRPRRRARERPYAAGRQQGMGEPDLVAVLHQQPRRHGRVEGAAIVVQLRAAGPTLRSARRQPAGPAATSRLDHVPQRRREAVGSTLGPGAVRERVAAGLTVDACTVRRAVCGSTRARSRCAVAPRLSGRTAI